MLMYVYVFYRSVFFFLPKSGCIVNRKFTLLADGLQLMFFQVLSNSVAFAFYHCFEVSGL